MQFAGFGWFYGNHAVGGLLAFGSWRFSERWSGGLNVVAARFMGETGRT